MNGKPNTAIKDRPCSLITYDSGPRTNPRELTRCNQPSVAQVRYPRYSSPNNPCVLDLCSKHLPK